MDRRMQTNFEAFWNPGSGELAIGVPGQDAEIDGHALEYAVFTAVDEGTHPILVSVIQQQRDAFWSIVRLPTDHRYVQLSPFSERDRAAETAFLLVSDQDIADADHRIAVAQTGAQSEAIQLRNFGDILSQDLIVTNLSRLFGEALVSIVSHRRSRAKTDGRPIMIGPAKMIWPLDSRIQIETIPTERLHSPDRRRLPGLAAIQQHLAAEDPPRVRLRLYLNAGENSGEFSYNRFSLVHVMHQRRLYERLKEQQERLNEQRGQSRSKALVEALLLRTIRDWLGDDQLHFDAAETDASILVVNLGTMLAATEDEGKADIVVTAGPGSTYVDVEFCSAAIGDDVGIASTLAGEGDFTVRPADRGGDDRIRLFRLRIDRLDPLQISSSDRIFRDVMACAGLEEMTRGAQKQSPAADGRRWTELLKRLNLPPNVERRGRLSSNPIGALLVSAWSELLQGRRLDPATAAAELQEFRRAPAITATLARFPRLSRGAVDIDAAINLDTDLPVQIALALGAPQLVPPIASPREWPNIWRTLVEPSVVHQLIDARIRIDGAPADWRNVRDTAAELHDEQRVRTAIECSIDRDMPEASEALRRYLEDRNNGTWTPLSTLSELPRIIRELVEDPIYQEQLEQGAPPEIPDDRDFDTMRSTVRGLLTEAQRAMPLNLSVKAMEREFDQRAKSKKLDRRLLRQFEQRLTKMVGLPGSDKLADELTKSLETWANLPDFAEQIRPRLRLLGSGPRRKRDIVEAIVSRVRPQAPKSKRYELDQRRSELSLRVHDKLTSNQKAAQDLKELAADIAGYADILLHHRAWIALDELAQKIESIDPPIELKRFQQRMKTWPCKAAETWEMGKHLASSFSGESERLEDALSPPTF